MNLPNVLFEKREKIKPIESSEGYCAKYTKEYAI